MIYAWKHISEKLKHLGGMAKAIESGVPKLRIEQSAASYKSSSELIAVKDIIVGLNANYSINEAKVKRS